MVRIPGSPRGRADELGGGTGDPASCGQPQGVGREPNLAGGLRPRDLDAGPANLQASRALRPRIRQPDPVRLRQSPATAPHPAFTPLIKYFGSNPTAGRYVDVGDAKIYYEVYGSGLG